MKPNIAIPTVMLAVTAGLFANAAQTSAVPSRAVPVVQSAVAQALPSCDLLDQATSANEDLAEAAVARDAQAVEAARLAVHETFGQIKPSLQPSAVARSSR